VKDPEIKFGLSVTGVIDPKKILTKGGGRPGDKLVLTKPLGTGILNTALKEGLLDQGSTAKVIAQMVTLNKAAAEVMIEHGASAATDITGFGLIGHAAEMVTLGGVGFRLNWNKIPLMDGAERWAKAGLVPGGTRTNREYREDVLYMETDVEEWKLNILFDPQTSGGLLIAVPAPAADEMLKCIQKRGHTTAAIIGEVVASPKGRIIIAE
jgi:selenide,water dikinase